MSKYNNERPRGNLLPRTLPPEPETPCIRYFIDADGNRISEPEEFVPDAQKPNFNRNQLLTETPKAAKERREKFVKKSKPTKEQLAEDKKSMTLAQMAERYSAGQSTVSSWIRDYGLQADPSERIKIANSMRQQRREERMSKMPENNQVIDVPDAKENELAKDADVLTKGEKKPECLADSEKYAVCHKPCDWSTNCFMLIESAKRQAEEHQPEPTETDNMDILKDLLSAIRRDYHDRAEAQFQKDIKRMVVEIGL
jgi:hypothetical protein